MVPVAYGRTAVLGGAAQGKGGIDPRLQPAAHQFEAIMMEQLLKPMERDPLFSDKSSGAGLVTGDAGSSTWSSLGVQSLARAISDAGGLGVATRVIEEVEAEAKVEGGGGKVSAAGGTQVENAPIGNAQASPLDGAGSDGSGRGNEADRPARSPAIPTAWSGARYQP